jgi:hypothetical protein
MVGDSPALFLTVMGILKATNLNDKGNSSPAGDIAVSFSVGFLTAWHVCQQAEMDAYAEHLEAGEPVPPTVKDSVPAPTIPPTFALTDTCLACEGNGILAEGEPCAACSGMGWVRQKNVADTPLATKPEPEHTDFEKTDKAATRDAEPCDHCNGTGAHGGVQCPKCFGNGVY